MTKLRHPVFVFQKLNKGVDERSRLQKKVEAVQTKLKELLTPEDMEEEGMADCLEPVIITLDHPALLSKSKSWFTLRDFKAIYHHNIFISIALMEI